MKSIEIISKRIKDLEYRRIGERNEDNRLNLNTKLRELRYILKQIKDIK